MGRCVPDGGVVLHDVQGQVPGPLFDILSHSYHPAAFTCHSLCAGDAVLEPLKGQRAHFANVRSDFENVRLPSLKGPGGRDKILAGRILT